MKLNSDDQTLAENKILILYILDKVGKPISHNELLELVISISDMNYFYFQQFLLDLLDDNYVSTFKQENDDIYELTEDGKNNILGSTVTTTATTATIIGGTILNNQTMDRIYEKYATSYVESMSDEDLESALMQLDLLAAKMDENTNEKTI